MTLFCFCFVKVVAGSYFSTKSTISQLVIQQSGKGEKKKSLHKNLSTVIGPIFLIIAFLTQKCPECLLSNRCTPLWWLGRRVAICTGKKGGYLYLMQHWVSLSSCLGSVVFVWKALESVWILTEYKASVSSSIHVCHFADLFINTVVLRSLSDLWTQLDPCFNQSPFTKGEN